MNTFNSSCSANRNTALVPPPDWRGNSILITGASGFIGSFLVEHALKAGMEVWAAVRKTSPRTYLKDPRIHFIELDLSDDLCLQKQLENQRNTYGPWNYVIHAAGATKCRNKSDFFKVNTDGTIRLARLLKETATLIDRFVFISSLSVMGAIREQYAQNPTPGWKYAPIKDDDKQVPNTAYGLSKQKAEEGLARIPGLNYICLRPTGVYGPRERDYFLMAKSIQQHTDFAVGFRPQEITFIYVKDLVEAAFLALYRGTSGRKYFLTDGGIYNSRTFSDMLQEELKIKRVLHIKAPLWILHLVCAISGILGKWTGNMPTLNMDKYHILKQRNWQCDLTSAQKELGYSPQYPLERGVKEAVTWYKENKWL